MYSKQKNLEGVYSWNKMWSLKKLPMLKCEGKTSLNAVYISDSQVLISSFVPFILRMTNTCRRKVKLDCPMYSKQKNLEGVYSWNKMWSLKKLPMLKCEGKTSLNAVYISDSQVLISSFVPFILRMACLDTQLT